MNLKLAVVTLLVIACFFSCKKDEMEDGNRLKREIRNDGTTLDSFIYDYQHLLMGTKNFARTAYDRSAFYDAQGKLFSVTYRYLGEERFNYEFVYNAAGQITRKNLTTFGFGGTNEVYAYDNQGRIVADSTYSLQYKLLYYYTYTYDKQGNIIEVNFKNVIDTADHEKTTYKFDSRPNPYKLEGNIYFYITGSIRGLNRNNFTEMKPSNTNALTNQYEYQKNGFPNKIVTTYPNSLKDAVTLEYW